MPCLSLLQRWCQSLLIWIAILQSVRAGYKTVCYYESWAVYRRVDGKLGADFSVDSPPCTHLIYAFAVLKDGLLDSFDPLVDLDGDGQYGGYQKFNLITKTKPVTTLLAVGGWNLGSKEFSDMAADPDTRDEFAKQAITYLRRHGFQGLDIDWEYPADRDGSRPEDKENFSSLLQDLRTAFDAETLVDGHKRLLLTAALSPHPDKLDKSYDLSTIGQYVDFVNLMTYDYARAGWSMEIKPHNPLWKRPEDTTWQSQLNTEWAVQKMIKDGIPAEKLILGIPTYGATYKINSKVKPMIHGSHLGGADAGPITKEKGYLAFHEICRRMKLEKGWIASMDQSGVPVCYRKNEWMSYESPKSARNKALFAMRYKLGGAMVWSLATDDFNGFCYGKKYPLTQILRDTFDASSKMMGRLDQYSAAASDTSDASSTEIVSQYCVADAKTANGDCQTKVYCPEINRNFLPYELSCVQTLGKCSYPRLQICDVPKLSTGSKPKYLLYMGDAKPANLTCSSGLSTKATIDITTVKDKCKKQSLSCQGNQLGGYNILNYICPAGSEFDTTLKVCKIPDTVDPDDDPCSETTSAVAYLPRTPLLTTTPYSYTQAMTRPLKRPGYQQQTGYGYGQSGYGYTQRDYYEKVMLTEAPPIAPEIPDPSAQVGNDGQSSQIDQQVELDNDQEDSFDGAMQLNAASIPRLIPPPVKPQVRLPPPRPLVNVLPKPVLPHPSPRRAEQPSRLSPATRSEVPLIPAATPMDDVPPSRSADRSNTNGVRYQPTRTKGRDSAICSPIGARVPNPKKPCSSSFLVCMSPLTIIELKCAKGLIFDATLQFCMPLAASQSCK